MFLLKSIAFNIRCFQVDCDKLDNGCNGGLPENAYKAIVKLGGKIFNSKFKTGAKKNISKCFLSFNPSKNNF